MSILFFPFCSPKTVPRKVPKVQVNIFMGPEAEITGKEALLIAGKKKLRFSGTLYIKAEPGKAFYSIELGQAEDAKFLQKSKGDFVVKRGGQFLLLHGRFEKREDAVREISRIGKGFPILIWERREGPLTVKVGRETFRTSSLKVKPGLVLLRLNGKSYRGAFTVKESAKGVEVDNILDIENFLKGCSPEILKYSPPLEAMKAQAVVMRTLALKKEPPLEAKEFYYSGVSGEHPLFSKAVEITKGQVLFFDNDLAYTPYTLSCGGITKEGGLPYLKSIRCMGRRWIVLESDDNHFVTEYNLVEALGLLKIEDPDEELTRSKAQQWLWGFSAYIGAGKFFPVEGELKTGFLRALAKTMMVLKPAETVEPLEYILDEGVAEEDDLREKVLTEGDASLFLYKALRALGKIHWEEGKIQIKENEVFINGEKIENVKLFRNGNTGFSSAEREMLLDGEPVKYLRNTKGRITAIVENGYSGEGEEIIWRKRYEKDALEERLKAYVPINDLQDIKINEKTPSGRVSELEIIGSENSYVLRGKSIREALALPSNLFIIDREYDEDGSISGFFFCGRGKGEGTGMCNFGAIRLAKEGENYMEILKFYYQGSFLRGEYGKIKRSKK